MLRASCRRCGGTDPSVSSRRVSPFYVSFSSLGHSSFVQLEVRTRLAQRRGGVPLCGDLPPPARKFAGDRIGPVMLLVLLLLRCALVAGHILLSSSAHWQSPFRVSPLGRASSRLQASLSRRVLPWWPSRLISSRVLRSSASRTAARRCTKKATTSFVQLTTIGVHCVHGSRLRC